MKTPNELTRQKLTHASMHCCNAQLLWLGERTPNFCPECGTPALFVIWNKHHPTTNSNWEILLQREVSVVEIENEIAKVEVPSTPPKRKVKYIGTGIEEIRWGGNDDPRDVLTLGSIYTLLKEEVHSWHTKYILEEFPKLKFNSVSFKEIS